MANYSSKIAGHPESNRIITKILAGEKFKHIAAEFGLAASTVAKFAHSVVKPATLANQVNTRSQVNNQVASVARFAKNVIPALAGQVSTADLVARKLGRYERILQKAEDKGELGNWASVDRAETAALQLQAQLRGEVNQVHTQTTVQMMVYTPQVHDEDEVTEVEVIDAAPAFEEVEAAPAADPVAEVLARLPAPRPKKPPKPLSRLQQLRKLSAKERQAAIRLIGQGIDPFAQLPSPPSAR